MDIAEFLAERLDEDQAAAEAAQGEVWTKVGSGEDFGPALGRMLFHRRFNPARVLREIAGKRRIVAECRHNPGAADLCLALRDYVLAELAAPYADHPDYDPAWAVADSA